MKGRWGTLLAWLTMQLATLCAGAMRMPLAARAGSETQHLALSEMVVVQLAVATLLFPILFDGGVGIAVAITALPFLQLAGFLTATPFATVSMVCLAMLLWFAGLAAWRAALRNARNQLIAIAVLNCIVIGGPLFSYLVREFSDSPNQPFCRRPAILDPLTCLLSQSSASTIQPSVFAAPTLLLASGAIAWWLRIKIFGDKLSTKLPTE